MRNLSYDKSLGTVVFASPNGASFPVSAKANTNPKLDVDGRDILDDLIFTMRSEPTEQGDDLLDSLMFTMRSEPTERGDDLLDSLMFTMRSEPTEDSSADTDRAS